MKKIYLAVPYSHDKDHIKAMRTILVDAKAADLMEQGYRVFSPISHSVPISRFTSDENNESYDFWLNQDFWILDACDELHILCLDGWAQSKGVLAEIQRAEDKGMKIVHHYYIRGQRI